MRKFLFAILSLFAVNTFAANPGDLTIGQYDAFLSTFFRPVALPGSGASGILIYDSNTTLPKLVIVDSTLTLTGSQLSVTSGAFATASDLAGKFNTPTGTTSQYVRGDGSLATLPTAASPSQSAQTRSLNSAFQPSTTRNALVSYSVQITVTANIAGGQNGDIILEIASDSGFTTNVQTVAIAGTGQTYTLAVALQGVQPQTSVVSGFVPAGYYTRLRTVQNTGTPSFSYRTGQEVLL